MLRTLQVLLFNNAFWRERFFKIFRYSGKIADVNETLSETEDGDLAV